MNRNISKTARREFRNENDNCPFLPVCITELAIERIKNSNAPRMPVFNTRDKGASIFVDNDFCK